MIPHLLVFFLLACEPSHDFYDEEIPELSCSDDPCCSEQQNTIQIPVDQFEEEAEDYLLA